MNYLEKIELILDSPLKTFTLLKNVPYSEQQVFEALSDGLTAQQIIEVGKQHWPSGVCGLGVAIAAHRTGCTTAELVDVLQALGRMSRSPIDVDSAAASMREINRKLSALSRGNSPIALEARKILDKPRPQWKKRHDDYCVIGR